MPTFAFLGLAASSYGAPQYYGYQNVPAQPSYPYSLAFFNNPYNPVQAVAPQPAVLTRTASNTVNNAPLGLTVDFDSSFGKYISIFMTSRNLWLNIFHHTVKKINFR